MGTVFFPRDGAHTLAETQDVFAIVRRTLRMSKVMFAISRQRLRNVRQRRTQIKGRLTRRSRCSCGLRSTAVTRTTCRMAGASLQTNSRSKVHVLAAVRARANRRSADDAVGNGRVRLRNDEVFDVAEAFDLDTDTLAGLQIAGW